MTRPREDKLLFYFGALDRSSLEFIYKISNELQIIDNPVIVYCSENANKSRPQIEDFRRIHSHYEVHQLSSKY